MTKSLAFVLAAASFPLVLSANPRSGQGLRSAAAVATIAYEDAVPIVQALRDDLLPAELRGRTAVERAAAWPGWVARRDADIRARVAEGDADSIIYLLQFGTSFTAQPRIGDRGELAGVLVRQAGGGDSRFVPSPLLSARIEDFIKAAASPAANARMQFARRVLERRGLDPVKEQDRVRQYLLDRVEIIGQAERAARLLDPDGDAVDQMTLFRDRGLASDTSILIDFGVEAALREMAAAGVLRPGRVRRVAIIGPGLDFTDKQEGYDFYPEQTIQPFAVVDSLMRLGLTSTEPQVYAFDLSARVLQHLEGARQQADAGQSYTVVVPRNLDRPWASDLARYWERFGEHVGERRKSVDPPPTAGRVAVKAVAIRPAVVRAIVPQDLNVVLQRLEPLSNDDGFDLILATNVLIYYDVFEQSLAAANVARMLRSGGVFLTNDAIVELPGSPLAPIGRTSVVYLTSAAGGGKGDRLVWYRHR